jgi:hypothetical protein
LFSLTGLSSAAMAALIVACAVSPTRSHGTGQIVPGQSWNLLLHISGGLAGFNRELRVSSTGDVTAIDRRRQVTAARRLSASELTQLDSLVAKLSANQSTTNARCRDCLRYHVEIRTSVSTITADLDDTTIVETVFEPLVKAATTLLTEVLSK